MGPSDPPALTRVTDPPNTEDDPRLRLLLMTMRSALIMVLGALEDYLRVQRSIMPRSARMTR